jgi:hypothetical protein
MEKDNKNTGGNNAKGPAKTGAAKQKKEAHPVTEEPLAEKDEVKQAEDELRERVEKNSKK